MSTAANEQASLHLLDYWRVIKGRKEIVIAVFLLVVLTGILFTLAMPKVYSASTIIQVTKEKTDIDVFQRERWSYDPLFLKTQFEIIQSRPVIEEVVRTRQLDRKLGDAYGFSALGPEKAFERAVKLISSSLSVQHYRDTNLIEIEVNLSEPAEGVQSEVAHTADTVARVFRDMTVSRSRRIKEDALEALKISLAEQKRRVVEATDRLEDIRQKHNINVISRYLGSAGTLEKTTLLRLEEQRIDLRKSIARKQSRLDMVNSLSNEDLVDTAPYLLNDAALQSLVTAKDETDVRLTQLENAGLGSKHPDVLETKATVKELERKIGDKLDGLRRGISNEFDVANAEYTEIESMLARIRKNEIQAESEGYLEFNKAEEELKHAKRIHDTLELRYFQQQIELDIPATTVQIIATAKPPDLDEFVSPNILLNVMLSLMLGLATGIGLAYFVEYIDTSVKNIDDVEQFLKAPVIGVIPQKVEAFTDRNSYRDHAEAYRLLRTNVRFSENIKGGKSFCVTSGSMAEGKSLTVFNLAYVCAQLGDRVLIVDADLHRPRQHKILNLSNADGLANVLVGQLPVEKAIIKTEHDNLSLLPSGKLTTGVHGLLDTARMRELITELSGKYDMVLYDAPPIIGVSDAALLVREVDGVMLVIQHRKYPRNVSLRAKLMIENTGAPLLGVVLNRINLARDYTSYYQYSYYYYARDTDGRRRNGSRPKAVEMARAEIIEAEQKARAGIEANAGKSTE